MNIEGEPLGRVEFPKSGSHDKASDDNQSDPIVEAVFCFPQTR